MTGYELYDDEIYPPVKVHLAFPYRVKSDLYRVLAQKRSFIADVFPVVCVTCSHDVNAFYQVQGELIRCPVLS